MEFTFKRNDQEGLEILLSLDNEKFNKWKGQKAKFRFSLIATATNNVVNPVDYQKVLLEKELVLEIPQMTFKISSEQMQNWLYQGFKLEIFYLAEFLVDEFLLGMVRKINQKFNDEKYFKIYQVPPSIMPKEAKSKMNLWKTFLIMNTLLKVLTILAILVILAGIASVPLSLLTDWPMADFFGHYALGSITVAMMVLIASFLRSTNYICLEFLPNLPKIGLDSQLKLGQLIRSEAKLDLHGLTVELVGHVQEKFKCVIRRSNRETTEITNANDPVNYITFYSQKIAHLPKGGALEGMVSENIDFKKFFNSMVPTFDIAPDYGVSMSMQICLRSNEFPDRVLNIPLANLEGMKML